MRRFLRENSLSVFFGAILLGSLIGQSFAGQHRYNAEALEHGDKPLSYGEYVLSTDFGANLLENWQSEFLQFALFIIATVWLVQKGSNESKEIDHVGFESDQRQQVGGFARANSPAWAKVRGLRLHLYANSLMIVMTLIFLASWLGQALSSWRAYNDEQADHEDETLSFGEYVVNADFWDRTLQNWQSEFLAVGTMAVFTIYLRQRGSPESKPVGAPHGETASSG